MAAQEANDIPVKTQSLILSDHTLGRPSLTAEYGAEDFCAIIHKVTCGC